MPESKSDSRFVAVRGGEKKAFLRRGAVVPRRRRKGRAIRLVLGAAILVGTVAGLSRFFDGSLFALARIQVSGNRRARTEDVLRLVEPWRGGNLIALDLSAIARAVGAHPWIARVTLSKRFPDGLSVRVTERNAVALYRDGSGLWWLSSEGRPIAPYDPRADATEYVLVSGDRAALSDAVGLLADLHSAPSEYFSALSEISALPDGGFGIMDTIFRRPVRVLRRDAPAKIRALLEARSFIESRGWEARAIDLRFADRIVLVGAYGAGNSL
ncbi:MAG TPA: FtsQ-type POTRA domain-containing protein [Thermoanaerobaculia bacterium]